MLFKPCGDINATVAASAEVQMVMVFMISLFLWGPSATGTG